MVKNLPAMQKTIKIKVLLFYYDIITFMHFKNSLFWSCNRILHQVNQIPWVKE